MSDNQSKFAIFQNADGEPTVAARFEDDDVWLTQKHLALLYKTTKQNVSQHIQSIFDSGELKESACVKKFFTVEEKFGRPAKIPVYHYNLDLIIDYAEYQALSENAMTMAQWVAALDDQIKGVRAKLLIGKGQVTHEEALAKAEQEFNAYRARELRQLESDFDKAMKRFLKKDGE